MSFENPNDGLSTMDADNPSHGIPATLRTYDDRRLAGVLKLVLPTEIPYYCEIEGGVGFINPDFPEGQRECGPAILEYWFPGDDKPTWMCAQCAGLVINVPPTA